MASLSEMLLSQLGGDSIRQIGAAIGADPTTARQAVGTAVPLLFSALAKNASSASGAASLLGALDRDHDGSVLDDLGSLLSSFQGGPGAAILGHVLGGQRGTVESGLANKTGLNAAAISQLLVVLAPMVMGMLGKAKRDQNLDVGGLSRTLQNEHEAATQASPDLGDLLGGLLGSGQGAGVAEAVKIGGGLLGALFGRKRR